MYNCERVARTYYKELTQEQRDLLKKLELEIYKTGITDECRRSAINLLHEKEMEFGVSRFGADTSPVWANMV